MANKLSVFFEDLPQVVRDIEDAKRLSSKWTGIEVTLRWKDTINKAIFQIKQDEQIYLFTWHTSLEDDYSISPGVVFISQHRIVHIKRRGGELLEIPLKKNLYCCCK